MCETDPLSLSDFWYISDMTSSIFKAAGLPTLKLVAIRHTVPKIFWIFALQTSLENWWQYATLSQKYSEYSHYKLACHWLEGMQRNMSIVQLLLSYTLSSGRKTWHIPLYLLYPFQARFQIIFGTVCNQATFSNIFKKSKTV